MKGAIKMNNKINEQLIKDEALNLLATKASKNNILINKVQYKKINKSLDKFLNYNSYLPTEKKAQLTGEYVFSLLNNIHENNRKLTPVN